MMTGRWFFFNVLCVCCVCGSGWLWGGVEEEAAWRGEWYEGVRKRDAARGFKPLWPTQVSAGVDYVLREERESAEAFSYRSPHFRFDADTKLSLDLARALSRVFESTYELVSVMPLDWQPERGGDFQVRFFMTRQAYERAGGPLNSGGVYLPKERVILVPLKSLGVKSSAGSLRLDRDFDKNEALTTVSHEITHQVMHDWLDKLPIWLIEGVAVYVESVPYRNGTYRFDLRKVREFVLRRTDGRQAVVPRLQLLMQMRKKDWLQLLEREPQESARHYVGAFLLAEYFFHRDGAGDGLRVRAFVDAVRAGMPWRKAQGLLLDGRSYETLEAEMVEAFAREKIAVLFR